MTDPTNIQDWAGLHTAMAHLSAVCDYAEQRDGVGFSSADASLGHYLGDLPATKWTLDDAITAATFATKYQRQLGIDGFADLVSEATAADLDAERRLRARAAVRKRASEARAAARAAAKRKSFAAKCKIVIVGTEVRFHSPYNAELVEAQKRIPGRRWNGQVNVYPLPALPALVDLCTHFAIPVSDDIAAQADRIADNPDAYAPTQVTVDGDTLVIKSDYNTELNDGLYHINGKSTWDRTRSVHTIAVSVDPAALRDLLTRIGLKLSDEARTTLDAAVDEQAATPNGTADLDDHDRIVFTGIPSAHRDDLRAAIIAAVGGTRRWGYGDVPTVPARTAPAALLAVIDSADLDITDAARERLTDLAAIQEKNFVDSVAADGDPVHIDGLGVTLMPHQHHAVAFAASHPRSIIADDMGLGKTIESIAALAHSEALPAVVICKPDLTANWAKEIALTLPHASVFIAESTKPKPIPEGTDIVVIGFAALRSKVTNPVVTLPAIDLGTPEPNTSDARSLSADEIADNIPDEHIQDARRAILNALSTRVAGTDDVVVALVDNQWDLRPWQLVIAEVLPHLTISNNIMAAARAARTDSQAPDVILTTTAHRKKVAKTERFGWVEMITAFQPQGFILDEGQFGKEPSAAQSRAMALVGRDVAARDGMILDLTGTPLVNRPRELAQQLVILGHLAPDGVDDPDGRYLFGEFGGFLFRYCGPKEQPGYGWTFKGASHLAELHTRLRSYGIYLRRRQDILHDLPDFTRKELTVTPARLDPVAWELYRQAEDDTIADFRAEAERIAGVLGVGITDPAVFAAMKGNSDHHLARLNALRQLLGTAKAPVVAEWIAEKVAEGEKVMVAAHHRNVVSGFAKQFGGLRIQGEQSLKSKESDKAAFQDKSAGEAPVIAVSIGAGGVGHTLTAARYGVQAELCWTPGEVSQMAKRIHRIGQTRDVEYHVALVPGTVDDYMWKMINDKQSVLDAVLDGADYDEEAIDTEATAATTVAFAMADQVR